jgi:hypothetical protein
VVAGSDWTYLRPGDGRACSGTPTRRTRSRCHLHAGRALAVSPLRSRCTRSLPGRPVACRRRLMGRPISRAACPAREPRSKYVGERRRAVRWRSRRSSPLTRPAGCRRSCSRPRGPGVRWGRAGRCCERACSALPGSRSGRASAGVVCRAPGVGCPRRRARRSCPVVGHGSTMPPCEPSQRRQTRAATRPGGAPQAADPR